MSKSHLELQMGTRQSTKCTEISRLAFQLWCIIPVPGRSSATILLSCVCQALNATPLAKAFFPISRENIQHLNPQPCISAGDSIAMCATSLWPLLFIPRCDLSQAAEASKDCPCPGPCPGCLSLALPSSPPAGVRYPAHPAALWTNSPLPEEQQPPPMVKEDDLHRGGRGSGGGWCPLAFGAAQAVCAPRGGRAGSRPRVAGAPRGAAAGSGRAAGAGRRGCPPGEGAAPALGSIMPGPPLPAAPQSSGCRSSLRAAPLPPLRPGDARGLGKGGKSIRREAGRGGGPSASLRSARAGGAVGRAPVRAQEGAELPEVPGAPAAPSGPDPRPGAGGCRRREKPPLLSACRSLAAPALPGWASRSWRCGCWRRRGSCAVSGRRPRGQRREPRRGGWVGAAPSAPGTAALRPRPAPSALGPFRGLAPRPGPRWGKGRGRRTVGMGNRTLSRELNGACPRAGAAAFCGASWGRENREEGGRSGAGQGGLPSREPVPTLSHVPLHSKTASVPGLLCSIHVDLLLLSIEWQQNKHPPWIWSVKRTEIPKY